MTRKNKVALLVALVAMSLSTIACGDNNTVNVAVGNSEIVNTAEEMVISDDCGLDNLWQQMGDDNKMSFLSAIYDECQSTNQSGEWNTEWVELTDMSLAEYRDS